MKTLMAGAAALALLGTVAAQDGYEDHYRAHQAATAQGDRDAMLTAGEAAWRAAEAELGEVETTAILAQNHLYDRLFADPEGAAEVAARALALGEAGLGLANMSLTELRAANAYVAASQKPKKDDLRDALLGAILADKATGRPLNPLAIGLYRTGSVLAIKDGDYTGAYDFVGGLTDEVRAAEGAPDQLLAGALVDEAAVLMMQPKPLPPGSFGSRIRSRRTKYEEQLSDAAILLAEAVSLFPEHGPIESFDPAHARAHAWGAVNGALLSSAKLSIDADHAYQGRTLDDFAPELAQADGDENGGPDCVVAWEDRKMRYPRLDRKWYNGAVYVGYHIGEDGRVEGARVLSEVPTGRFGPAVLEEMQGWKADTSGLAPACLGDKTTVFKFVVN